MAVYRQLLTTYGAENIGIYGSSAGAVLSSQLMAKLLQEQQPLPCAIGMFFASAHGWHGGDSSVLARALNEAYPIDGISIRSLYFQGADEKDPLVFPGWNEHYLSKFPPSLLISSFRDFALSPVIKTHSELVRLGVSADLQVWDGLDHVFHYDPRIQESREAYQCIVTFFDKHLGARKP